ncbi:hypothetical protein SteCoe_11685 [Stentor coeruleus]|uniref:Cyclic nucleotide-binding domain-containing protein n=1 Tax=Stentor coeruleus TaxID=5963 RepID=A0A1R2CCL6_9CILI|nr:hypothetical protein SteCoe_11685 [Stentor coeruleus]
MAKYERVELEEINNLRSQNSTSIKSEKVPAYLLNVTAISRLQWDTFLLLFGLYNAFDVVYYLSFECVHMFDPTVKVVGLFLDLVCIGDLYINFTTTYIDSHTGENVLSLSKISFKYLKTTLIIDLLSAVPIFFIGISCTVIDITITLVRLSKILRIFTIVNRLMYFRLKKTLRLVIKFFELALWICIYLHLMACFWYVIVIEHKVWQPFSLIVRDEDFYERPLKERYSWCLYTIVSSISRIEMMPSYEYEYVILAIFIVAGMLIVGVLYGSIIVILQDLSKGSFKFAQEQEKISTTIKNLNLPNDLQASITDFFNNSFSILDQEISYQKLIHFLPPSIKKKLNANLFEKLFKNSKLFLDQQKLIKYLLQQLDNKFCQPEEAVIKQFEPGDCMYFVSEGKCEVEVLDQLKEKHVVRFLEVGSVFGEISVLFNTPRTATIKSIEFTTLAVLNNSKIQALFNKFPNVKKVLLNNVSKYKDPYRIFVDKILSKLTYLQSLDIKTFNKLVYSLPVYSCPVGTDLFVAGDLCNSCFMILDGTVQILFEVHGKTVFKKIIKKGLEKHSQKSGINKKIKSVNLVVEELGKGSVLCQNLLVLKQRFLVSCRCIKQARIMVFNQEHLDEILQRFPYIKQSIEETIVKYTPTKTAPDILVLDYHKSQKYGDEQRKNSLKTRIRFKNTVINRILVIREQKKKQQLKMQVVLERLKAIIQAESMGRNDLAHKIIIGELQPEAISVEDLLKKKYKNSPLLAQFALKSKETLLLSESFKEYLKDLSKKFEELKKNSSSTQENVHHLQSLYTDLQKYLNN